MKSYTFSYQEELHINSWGTERVNCRFVNGKKFSGYSDADLPVWFKTMISNSLKKQKIELVFEQSKFYTSESGNLSLKVSTDTYYLSQEVEITVRTNKDLTHYLS